MLSTYFLMNANGVDGPHTIEKFVQSWTYTAHLWNPNNSTVTLRLCRSSQSQDTRNLSTQSWGCHCINGLIVMSNCLLLP